MDCPLGEWTIRCSGNTFRLPHPFDFLPWRPKFAVTARCGYFSVMNRSLHIDYPSSLPDALQQTPAGFEREARMAMAVKLYEMKRLSSGQAASLAGVDRTTFVMRLAESGTAMIDFPAAEELADDIDPAGPA
jgi:predicted HTH domain antitoxin